MDQYIFRRVSVFLFVKLTYKVNRFFISLLFLIVPQSFSPLHTPLQNPHRKSHYRTQYLLEEKRLETALSESQGELARSESHNNEMANLNRQLLYVFHDFSFYYGFTNICSFFS